MNLYKKVYRITNIETAWLTIRRNGLKSISQKTLREIRDFEKTSGTGIRKIRKLLSDEQFNFPASLGITIPKPNSEKKRAIVKSPIPSRIVQRSIHDCLMSNSSIQHKLDNPYSFGGVKKKGNEGTPVSQAIFTILKALSEGKKYYVRSDIKDFFTTIKKAPIVAEIAKLGDSKFTDLFTRAIKTELENMKNLTRKGDVGSFPTHEIGVAQGNCLSPLIGNLYLSDFDIELNSDEISCIRYIDDFVILAKSRTDATRTFRRAKKILEKKGLICHAPNESDKASSGTFVDGLSFLGIDMQNGIVRPNKSSRMRFVLSIKQLVDEAIGNFKLVDSKNYALEKSLVSTLTLIDRKIEGWGKQYSYCNEKNLFKSLDKKISEQITRLIGSYTDRRKRHPSQDSGRKLLGVRLLQEEIFDPFIWPK